MVTSSGPDAARGAVALGERDVALREALAALQVVGEELVLAAVGDPQRLLVGPHATGRAVLLVQLELTLLDALAGVEVVCVDGVVGAVAVLEQPEGGAIRPRARGRVVGGVELVDVALHRPLEVDLAGTGPGAAAAAANETTNEATSRASAVLDRDRHRVDYSAADTLGQRAEPQHHPLAAILVGVAGGEERECLRGLARFEAHPRRNPAVVAVRGATLVRHRDGDGDRALGVGAQAEADRDPAALGHGVGARLKADGGLGQVVVADEHRGRAGVGDLDPFGEGGGVDLEQHGLAGVEVVVGDGVEAELLPRSLPSGR